MTKVKSQIETAKTTPRDFSRDQKHYSRPSTKKNGAGIPATETGVPESPVLRQPTEGSRPDLLAKMARGDVQSFSQIVSGEEVVEAMGVKISKSDSTNECLHKAILLAQNSLNGSIHKAVARATAKTGYRYVTSANVSLIQTPWRVVVSCHVQRVE